jgi:hypothetical protein
MTKAHDRRDLLQEIVDAAERHGRVSDSDHEVGDLQDALRGAWSMLTPAQRKSLHRTHFCDHERWTDADGNAAELQ